MHIVITGSVASGKTEISNEIKKRYPYHKFIVINDKEFSKKEELGSINKDTGDYEVDISLLSKKTSSLLNNKKNIIFEGHLFCELSKLFLKKMDFVFLLITKEKILRERMQEREYNILKIEENILCFKTGYFENKLKSKNIDFITLEVTNDIKLNLKKMNKYLKL